MKLNTPKSKITVTVGISAYNEEKNIEDLLSSILSQKQDNFELKKIIVISDGSTDNTAKLVSNFKDKRIQLIEGKTRIGQSKRQNQILKKSYGTDCLALFEADTLPKNTNYLGNLIKGIPENLNYSLILANSQPVPATTLFNKVMTYGFQLRREIFENSQTKINLYLYTTGLISAIFMKDFRWDEKYNEDSYCYRKALESNLPIIRNKKAILYIKPVDNLYDYLIQSGKFQKSKDAEQKISNIYNLQISKVLVLKIIFKHFLKNPFYLLSYLSCLIIGRIYGIFLPSYHPFWETYLSTKKVINHKGAK